MVYALLLSRTIVHSFSSFPLTIPEIQQKKWHALLINFGGSAFYGKELSGNFVLVITVTSIISTVTGH